MKTKILKIALTGNQNSGKTTLFNRLTGANQRVGNFPGVTVEKKEGDLLATQNVTVVDLPGIYSLAPYSSEEIVTRRFLLEEPPSVIINVVDVNNLVRSLNLTLQLLALEIPTVLALNMMDEFRTIGGRVDLNGLSSALGIPVLPISARTGEGVDELVKIALSYAGRKILPQKKQFPSLAEEDENAEAVITSRFLYIEKICQNYVTKPRENKARKRSDKIDKVLTGKYTAFPAFALIMSLVFYLTFGPVGGALTSFMEEIVEIFSDGAERFLTAQNANPILISLVVDGIFAGVGGVLSFLPTLLLLFLLLSVLEDTGYMARIAFILDRPLQKIGLSGKSFVPLILGFGCSVPAIMSTRTLPSDRERKLSAILAPFMSCSAKIPVYGMLASAFFGKSAAFVVICLYLIGILIALCAAAILNKTAFRGVPAPFILEMPDYRLPMAKSVFRLAAGRAKDFLKRAFTLIFTASVIVWFLQSFDGNFNFVDDSSQSLLAKLSGGVSVIFKPLGLGDWRLVTALATGIMAKESVKSTLDVLLGDGFLLAFTPLSAFVFMLFFLLYTPCIAALAAVKKEFGRKWAIGIALGQFVFAWILCFFVAVIGAIFV